VNTVRSVAVINNDSALKNAQLADSKRDYWQAAAKNDQTAMNAAHARADALRTRGATVDDGTAARINTEGQKLVAQAQQPAAKPLVTPPKPDTSYRDVQPSAAPTTSAQSKPGVSFAVGFGTGAGLGVTSPGAAGVVTSIANKVAPDSSFKKGLNASSIVIGLSSNKPQSGSAPGAPTQSAGQVQNSTQAQPVASPQVTHNNGGTQLVVDRVSQGYSESEAKIAPWRGERLGSENGTCQGT
jgi:hypothetical protein